jgi:hypothetical protein
MSQLAPASIDTLVTRTIALAQSYRRSATSLLDEGHARLQAGRLSQDGFNHLFGDYLAILQKAVDVNNAAAHGLAEGIRPVLEAVESASTQLERKLAALTRTEDLISVSVKLLAAMGAVAAAVFAPTPATAAAAAAAIGDAVSSVVDVAKKPD